VFGRGKPQQTTRSGPASPGAEAKVGGKGRPTPTRREAERRNRHPIVAGSALPSNATKEEKKAARTARRAAADAQRRLQRQAMMTGDEAHLPARDRGPARRWARDYVDARRSVGEFFLPLALLVLVMSVIPNRWMQLASVAVLYSMMLAVIVDSFLLRRTLKRETESRFGDKAAGAPGYGMVRALQYRRFRMPRAQVPRGQYPR